MPKIKTTKAKERICVDCRISRCSKHDNPIHGITEAEASLALANLGFKIVAKGSTTQVTAAELERVVAKQKIDSRGYVTYGE